MKPERYLALVEGHFKISGRHSLVYMDQKRSSENRRHSSGSVVIFYSLIRCSVSTGSVVNQELFFQFHKKKSTLRKALWLFSSLSLLLFLWEIFTYILIYHKHFKYHQINWSESNGRTAFNEAWLRQRLFFSRTYFCKYVSKHNGKL